MSSVTARIKAKGKQYEILVDLDEALKLKDGKGNILSALQSQQIYYDVNKGNIASKEDLIDAFGTIDSYQIATKIITSGEVQKNQDYRDAEKEAKQKKVVDLILRNAVDQHGRPYTEQRIRTAIQEVHFSFDNRPPEQQMQDLIHKLKEVIPIKIETKRVKLTIPAQYTGHVYGLLHDYKESEEWLPNGNLQAIMNIPAGLIIDFYDKINSVTHGAVQSEEMKE
ncbi:MAG: ribosome assembly factor SBDS [Nanoarchaeota archaeon]|nr:ribosome assembly factor SBDS [Nanoarchaeota archaeon]